MKSLVLNADFMFSTLKKRNTTINYLLKALCVLHLEKQCSSGNRVQISESRSTVSVSLSHSLVNYK